MIGYYLKQKLDGSKGAKLEFADLAESAVCYS
jgi:hypothetical protein